MNLPITIDDLTLIKYLDKGGFAEIYLSKKKGISEVVATKRLDQNKLNRTPALKKYLENEILILNSIKHPNIIRLYDVKRKPDYIYIVMELCNGGSLHDCLQNYKKKYKKPFTEEIVQYLMKQILSGLKCLHDQKIIHRDLKLSNILINYKSENDIKNLNILSGQVKIIDFNASTKPGIISAQTAIGTAPNMAPSVVNNFLGNRGSYDEKVDIWSLGTLCYEMLVGKELFDGAQVMQKIKNCSDIKIPENISETAKSFLLSMLQKESEKRLSVNDLLKHEFITKNPKNFNSVNNQKNNSNKIPNNKSNNPTNNNIKDTNQNNGQKKLISLNQINTVETIPINNASNNTKSNVSNPIISTLNSANNTKTIDKDKSHRTKNRVITNVSKNTNDKSFNTSNNSQKNMFRNNTSNNSRRNMLNNTSHTSNNSRSNMLKNSNTVNTGQKTLTNIL